MLYFCFPSLSETPQQDLPVKFLSALLSVCDDEGRYLHHLLQVHLCAGSCGEQHGELLGPQASMTFRILRNVLVDTPLHSAESHQLCRGTARTKGGDSGNNMATTAVSPLSFSHPQSCSGSPDSL